MDKLLLDVFYQEGDPPFICSVSGRCTTYTLNEIEKDLCENPPSEFDHGDGTYTFSASYFAGQYGEYGQCEFPPGFELSLKGFVGVEHG